MANKTTGLYFQYQHPGDRPDDFTLSDAGREVESSAEIPSVGDLVWLPLASKLRHPEAFEGCEPGQPVAFRVARRIYLYGGIPDGRYQGHGDYRGGPTIYVIVTRKPEDGRDADFKQ